MRLSLCIATFRRAAYIAATLDNILEQLPADAEVVVVDGASPDDTPGVMAAYAQNPQVRYVREAENSGVDRDYDKAVGYAQGDYCWLMTDDDLLVPGAIARVLEAIASGPELVVVNAEIRDREVAGLLKASQLPLQGASSYGASELEALFADAGSYLSFIGGVVVRRALWLARERAPWYGSLFIHVGVLFSQPVLGAVVVVREPLIRIRYGNAMWTARSFEIWTAKWPLLVWSFSHFSEQARARVSPRAPAASLRTLVWYRGIGALDAAELRRLRSLGAVPGLHPCAQLVASLPRRPLNLALTALCRASSHGDARMKLYDLARTKGA
jgi:glycosyltransferase involved in cell wall biosynthesis